MTYEVSDPCKGVRIVTNSKPDAEEFCIRAVADHMSCAITLAFQSACIALGVSAKNIEIGSDSRKQIAAAIYSSLISCISELMDLVEPGMQYNAKAICVDGGRHDESSR